MLFLNNFVKSIENPDHPLMGPVLWIMKVAGMWKTNKIFDRATIVQSFAIITLLTEFIELWQVRTDLEKAIRNLSISTLSFICVIKSSTFVLWRNDWKKIIEYVSDLEIEQLFNKDKETTRIIKQYIKYARNITYFYWLLTFCTVWAVMLAPLVIYLSSSEYRELIRNGSAPYPELISSWVPFDKSRGFGYIVIVIIQISMLVYGGFTVTSYDTNVVALMTFFYGQLQILKENCKTLFNDVKDARDLIRKIHNCHHHHNQLIAHARLLNSLLSPVMFMYIVICSLMICASAIQITTEETTITQKLWVAEYLGAIVAQLFLYCWHSNQVYTMSLTVRDGVYNSAWWTQEAKVRKNVVLLSGKLNETIQFYAGPFTKLNIATFVAIIKASYSYYTLLNQK